MPPKAIQTVEFDGVVIPTQWDRRGNVIQVAIQTENFEKYLIGDKVDLLEKIDQHIHVKGAIVGEDVKGLQILKIDSISNPAHS